TSYTIAGFFLAMTIYSEVLKKAHAEVDVIVRNKQLPTMMDHGVLLYMNALCKELLRWNILIPMYMYCHSYAFLHRATLYM
ncbi:hypothetical protein HD554DRAFT_2030125, partial [Boletus coccyginus]